MQRLSDSAAAEWCTGRGIHVGGSPADRSLVIAESHPYTFRVRVPVAAPRRLALAHELLTIGAGQAFVGGMFWLTDWDIWTETVERASRLLRCRLHGEHQAQTDARNSQAELYSAEEAIEIQSAVTLALIFEWDAYVIPAVGDVLAFISHDGYVEFAARTQSALAPTLQRLGPYQKMVAAAVVWAGDQLIWELRQASQSPGETSGPSDAYGTVSYTHAGGIDRPLVITKNGESVLPHQNWRGQFSRGTYASGTSSDCAPGHLHSDQERRRNSPMNGEIDPDDAAEAVRTRKDFAAFVRLLLRDLSISGEAWENDTLPRFLEALAACSDDLAHAYRNQGRPLPVSPTWQMFAELLNSARIYE